ncbi:MAG: hypothetical protein RL722_2087, partial [Pseudomonadota bacterium]
MRTCFLESLGPSLGEPHDGSDVGPRAVTGMHWAVRHPSQPLACIAQSRPAYWMRSAGNRTCACNTQGAKAASSTNHGAPMEFMGPVLARLACHFVGLSSVCLQLLDACHLGFARIGPGSSLWPFMASPHGLRMGTPGCGSGRHPTLHQVFHCPGKVHVLSSFGLPESQTDLPPGIFRVQTSGDVADSRHAGRGGASQTPIGLGLDLPQRLVAPE